MTEISGVSYPILVCAFIASGKFWLNKVFHLENRSTTHHILSTCSGFRHDNCPVLILHLNGEVCVGTCRNRHIEVIEILRGLRLVERDCDNTSRGILRSCDSRNSIAEIHIEVTRNPVCATSEDKSPFNRDIPDSETDDTSAMLEIQDVRIIDGRDHRNIRDPFHKLIFRRQVNLEVSACK